VLLSLICPFLNKAQMKQYGIINNRLVSQWSSDDVIYKPVARPLTQLVSWPTHCPSYLVCHVPTTHDWSSAVAAHQCRYWLKTVVAVTTSLLTMTTERRRTHHTRSGRRRQLCQTQNSSAAQTDDSTDHSTPSVLLHTSLGLLMTTKFLTVNLTKINN